jgi:hypothetical protein
VEAYLKSICLVEEESWGGGQSVLSVEKEVAAVSALVEVGYSWKGYRCSAASRVVNNLWRAFKGG